MFRGRAYGVCVFSVAMLASVAMAQDTRRPGELFPVIEPFDTGRLQVSDLHTIAYSLCGNPRGKPVFVLHGGPGFGCYPRLVQYFNPEKFLIVLHDQRGSGRSTPLGELRENTTQHLVADIERLREHLKIERKVMVFGGSWGSTLALAYAETHPERVSGMVIRGVFTSTRAELENIFGEGSARQFFPDAVARMEAAIPAGEVFEAKSLLRIFTGQDDATIRSVAEAWVRYAIKTGKMHASDEEVKLGLGDYDILPGARIDCHYGANGCFLEEGQLLRDAHRLKDIPITIINGRYDMTCPPVTAWRLHQLLPKSELVIVEEAGHSEEEEGTTRALVEAVAAFE